MVYSKALIRIEDTVANAINTTYVRCMMRTLDVILSNIKRAFLYSYWLYFLLHGIVSNY